MSKIPNIKKIIAIASGKGGVGKSTTAMNLAVALSLKGLKIGLLDADIFGPSQPRMLGAKDARPQSPDGENIEPIIAAGIKSISMGYMLENEADPIIWRGPMVQSALLQMLNQVNWGLLDMLLIDMPPGTGDVPITISQKAGLDGAIIISTPQDIALIDAVKALNMFKKVDVPIVGIIENMSMFVCPKCGHENHIFAHGGAREKASELKIPLLAEIPLDLKIRQNTDAGKPLVTADPKSPQAAIYRNLAEKVVREIANLPVAIGESDKVKVVIE